MMRIGRLCARAAAFACVFGWGAVARAHLMDAQQGTVNVVGDSVFAVLSVPVSALSSADDDGDGLLSAEELSLHLEALEAQVDRRFAIESGSLSGATVRVDLVLAPEHTADPSRAPNLIALKHTRFPAPPTDVQVQSDLFGANGAGPDVTFTATRMRDAVKESEVAVLTARANRHRFFAPVVPAEKSGAQTNLQLLLALAAAITVAMIYRARGREVSYRSLSR